MTGEMAAPDRPSVLYVTGMLRCGSTVIGNVLDTLPGVVHVGELHYLWRNGILGEGTNSTCGCGAHLSACPFWMQVARAAGIPVDRASARGMTALQDLRLRIRHVPARLAESTAHRVTAPGVPEALDTTVALYRALAENGGRRLIVDSSKYPAEAAALLGRTDVDVRVLHVVRDPRATAWSYRAGKHYIAPMSTANVVRYWVAFNLASELLGARFPGRYLRVRHEDFTAAPAKVITGVLRFAGLDDPSPIDPTGHVDLAVNHTVTGNPDRLRHGPTRIRSDQRWRTAMGPARRALATVPTAPLLWRYRYLGGARPTESPARPRQQA